MVVAVVALIVSLSGTAVAAKLITGKQIAKGTITGKNIKNGSVTMSDISEKTKAKLRSKAGPAGPAGANGTNGINGTNGLDGASTVVSVTAPNSIFEEKRNAHITASGALLEAGHGDNSILGDAVVFRGFDGMKLKDLARFGYTASYHHNSGVGGIWGADNGDAPYMLLLIDNGGDQVIDHDIAFTPSTQPGACYGGGGPSSPQCTSSDRMIHYDVEKSNVRYDDDPGSGPDYPWDKIISDHPDDVIYGIRVQAGNSLPGTENAKINSINVEAKGKPPVTYFFGTL